LEIDEPGLEAERCGEEGLVVEGLGGKICGALRILSEIEGSLGLKG